MLEQLTAWIVALMIALQPTAPWRSTYEASARAYATVALDAPLFKGDKATERTAALFVSVAWFESRFDQKALGDRKCIERDSKTGKCTKEGEPQSICAFQVGVSNLAGLGKTKADLLGDIMVCTRAAREMMRISFRVCANRSAEDLLGHYASGGETCGGPAREDGRLSAGLVASRNRMGKAIDLLRKYPFSVGDVTAGN